MLASCMEMTMVKFFEYHSKKWPFCNIEFQKTFFTDMCIRNCLKFSHIRSFEIREYMLPLYRHLKAQSEQLVADPDLMGPSSNGRETTNINQTSCHLSAFRAGYSIMLSIVPV